MKNHFLCRSGPPAADAGRSAGVLSQTAAGRPAPAAAFSPGHRRVPAVNHGPFHWLSTGQASFTARVRTPAAAALRAASPPAGICGHCAARCMYATPPLAVPMQSRPTAAPLVSLRIRQNTGACSADTQNSQCLAIPFVRTLTFFFCGIAARSWRHGRATVGLSRRGIDGWRAGVRAGVLWKRTGMRPAH